SGWYNQECEGNPGKLAIFVNPGAPMRTRHRIPTIFNLSMVDVLCCALGCVILLWLLNLREAKEETLTAGKTLAQLKSTQTLLEETTTQRDRLQRDLQTDRSQLALL